MTNQEGHYLHNYKESILNYWLTVEVVKIGVQFIQGLNTFKCIKSVFYECLFKTGVPFKVAVWTVLTLLI